MIPLPYKSEAQRRYFNSPKGKKEIGEEEVEHWNEVSKGMELPEKSIDKAIRSCAVDNEKIPIYVYKFDVYKMYGKEAKYIETIKIEDISENIEHVRIMHQRELGARTHLRNGRFIRVEYEELK